MSNGRKGGKKHKVKVPRIRKMGWMVEEQEEKDRRENKRENDRDALDPSIADHIISKTANGCERRRASERFGLKDAPEPRQGLPRFHEAWLQTDDDPGRLGARESSDDRPERPQGDGQEVSNRSIEGAQHRFCL